MPNILYIPGDFTARTAIYPPGAESYEFIYGLAIAAGERFPWRGRPPVRTFIEEVLWSDTFEHAVVTSRSSGQQLAYVAFNRMNYHHGTVYLSLYVAEAAEKMGYPIEAAALLLSRLFKYTSCRKVYFESTEREGTFEIVGRSGLFEEEGRLRDYFIVQGRPCDLLIRSLSRERFEEVTQSSDVLRLIGGTDGESGV